MSKEVESVFAIYKLLIGLIYHSVIVRGVLGQAAIWFCPSNAKCAAAIHWNLSVPDWLATKTKEQS